MKRMSGLGKKGGREVIGGLRKGVSGEWGVRWRLSVVDDTIGYKWMERAKIFLIFSDGTSLSRLCLRVFVGVLNS